jgi:hypothetical protein
MITPQKTPQWIGAAILLACIAICSCKRNTVITSLPPGKTDSTDQCYTCTVLRWDSLKALLATNEKVVVEIYPVKYSPDMSVCRVDLATYLRGQQGNRIARTEDLPDKIFKQASKNFAAYLKKNNVPREKAAMGYELIITSATRAEKYVKICYNPRSRRTDPPQNVVFYDSCRVPPGCAERGTPQSNFVREAIDEVYLNIKD